MGTTPSSRWWLVVANTRKGELQQRSGRDACHFAFPEFVPGGQEFARLGGEKGGAHSVQEFRLFAARCQAVHVGYRVLQCVNRLDEGVDLNRESVSEH